MAGMQGSQIGDEGVELVAARDQDQASSGAEEAGDAFDPSGQRRVGQRLTFRDDRDLVAVVGQPRHERHGPNARRPLENLHGGAA